MDWYLRHHWKNLIVWIVGPLVWIIFTIIWLIVLVILGLSTNPIILYGFFISLAFFIFATISISIVLSILYHIQERNLDKFHDLLEQYKKENQKAYLKSIMKEMNMTKKEIERILLMIRERGWINGYFDKNDESFIRTPIPKDAGATRIGFEIELLWKVCRRRF